MAKKKFYAVKRGRKPGIYTEWEGLNGAEAQVKGFVAPLFKGFATREEAEKFMQTGEAAQPGLPGMADISAAAPKPVSAAVQPAPLAVLPEGQVIIYTDGASSPNPGPGGWGAVIFEGSQRRELSDGYRCTTNNRMEMLGVIRALQTLEERKTVTLYTDSSYVANAITKGWARCWKANGWMRPKDQDGISRRAENADLWEDLLALLEKHSVQVIWVKGHADTPENERCDRLAVAARQQRNLPVDPGFGGKCR